MAGEVSISVSSAQYDRLAKDLADVKNGVPRALVGALNKTVDAGATSIRKRLAEGLGLKVSDLRKRVKPIKAFLGQSANASNFAVNKGKFVAKIRLQNFNIPLAKIKKSKPPASGSYALSPVGDPQALPHPSFKAKLASGHLGFFVRKGAKVKPGRGSYAGRTIKRGPRKGQPILRQPIKEVYGPSPRHFFETAPGVAKEELAKLPPILAKNLQSQVDRFAKPKS